MSALANETDRDLILSDVCHRKADCVPVALRWQMRTSGGITQIAELSYLRLGWRQLLAGSATISSPSRAQRKARWMGPRTVVDDCNRHKKWARQVSFLEERSL